MNSIRRYPDESHPVASTSKIMPKCVSSVRSTSQQAATTHFPSLPEESRPSAESLPNFSTSETPYRLVGRGGRGSRPRTLSPTTPELNRSIVTPVNSPLNPTQPVHIRLMGRGGSGSIPRVVSSIDPYAAGELCNVQCYRNAEKEFTAQLLRLSERGSAGPRPRAVSPPSEPNTLNKWKDKGKLKISFKTKRPSSSPQVAFASGSGSQLFRDTALAEASSAESLTDPPSSVTTTSDSTSLRRVVSTDASSFGDEDSILDLNYVNRSLPRHGKSDYEKSMNKLARTLGHTPLNPVHNKSRQRNAHSSPFPKISSVDLSQPLPKRSIVRTSLSVASLSSLASFLRSPVPRFLSSGSQGALSSIEDENRRPRENGLFGLWDDNGSCTSLISDGSSSPITFAVPLPPKQRDAETPADAADPHASSETISMSFSISTSSRHQRSSSSSTSVLYTKRPHTSSGSMSSSQLLSSDQ